MVVKRGDIFYADLDPTSVTLDPCRAFTMIKTDIKDSRGLNFAELYFKFM